MDAGNKEQIMDDKIGFIIDACPQLPFEEAKKCLEAWNGNVALAIDDALGVLGFTIDSSKQNSTSVLPGDSNTWKLKFIADIEDIDQRVIAEEIRDLLPNTAQWKIIEAIECYKDDEAVKNRAVNMLMDEEAKNRVKSEQTDEGLPYRLAQNKLDFSTGDAGPSGTSQEEMERDFAENLNATSNSNTKGEESSVRLAPSPMEIADSDDDNDKDEEMEDGYFSDVEAAQLRTIFPGATYDECKNELNITTPVRNMEEAIEALGERFAEENAQNSDAGISGTKDKGKGKEEVAPKVNGKRPGENLGSDIPEKRARTTSSEQADEQSSLEDASSWVRAFYDQTGQVKVILDQGEHPCRFTVHILRNLTAYRDALTHAINTTDPAITILNVRQEIFDMAMQWSVCKRVQIKKRATAPEHTDVLLEFIEFAQKAGLNIGILDDASEILAQIKELLIQYRNSLLEEQFRKVYEIFPLGHPLCNLFVNASIRPWFEFCYEDGRKHNGDSSDSEPEGGWRSAAHKAAFGKKKFSLEKLLIGENAITKFQADFFTAQQRCWFGRKKIDVNRFNKRKPDLQTHANDPLTGDIFVV